ncbi:MAG TPA: phage tail sheath C-terminal domain-containing protein [Terriglobales bacterium]
MPEYLYPGVYVEEIDTGNKPIEGVSTSTAGFLGVAERGGLTPALLTSFGDYQRAYGSYVKDASGDHYLAYAVEGFFQNGGLRCFVQRVAHQDTVTPANSAMSASTAVGGMAIAAAGPGAWGNNVAYQISNAGLADPTLFKLTLFYWTGTPYPDMMSDATLTEVYDNLSSVPTASTFYDGEINNVSNLITVTQTAAGRPPNNALSAGKDPNLLAGNVATTAVTLLTVGGTLLLTAGAATVTFTVAPNPVKGPTIITVTDLINNINLDTVVGARAYLNRTGNLTIVDPYGRGTLAVTGTLAAAGVANLGTFAAAAPALNNAGTPVLLKGGSEGLNPNVLVSGNGGLMPATALTDTDTLVLTSGAHTIPFPVNAAAGPIKTVSDLITAIGTDATVGAQATLDASGRLNISDPLLRGNLAVTGTLATPAGQLGEFAAAAAQLTLADFEGNDINPASKTGLLALGDVDEISLLCCPDEYYFGPGNTNIAGLLTQQCESLMDRFAILEASPAAVTVESNNPSVNSEYAAYYYPWLTIANPNTGVQLLVPPCGHIAGIYARSDTNVGVQKDPANEVINGIVQLQLPINNQQQAILNPKGVNCLRYFTGAGNLVWGGRTTSTDPDWLYINVRRIFIFVETSIQRGTQWVVFDINSDPTWRRVVRSVSDFLTGLWRDGVLQGDTKDEAFFVRCDNTTMSQADIDAGRLICVIGIAPVKPAEFVIFQIGQWYGGSNVTEQ